MKPLKNSIPFPGRPNQLQFTMLRMRSPRNPSRIQILMLLPVLNVSDVVNPSAEIILQYAKLRMFTVMSVASMVIFRLYAKVLNSSPSELRGSRNLILPIENRLIMFQMLQFKMQQDSTMSKVIGLQNLLDPHQ